jgi:hypothetical protein
MRASPPTRLPVAQLPRTGHTRPATRRPPPRAHTPSPFHAFPPCRPRGIRGPGERELGVERWLGGRRLQGRGWGGGGRGQLRGRRQGHARRRRPGAGAAEHPGHPHVGGQGELRGDAPAGRGGRGDRPDAPRALARGPEPHAQHGPPGAAGRVREPPHVGADDGRAAVDVGEWVSDADTSPRAQQEGDPNRVRARPLLRDHGRADHEPVVLGEQHAGAVRDGEHEERGEADEVSRGAPAREDRARVRWESGAQREEKRERREREEREGGHMG